MTEEFNLLGGNDSAISILKEYFKKDDITTKTDINSMAQIRVLCQTRLLSESEEDNNLSAIQIMDKKVIPFYLELKASYKRRSRLEVVDALKNLNPKFLDDAKNMPEGFNK